VTLRQSRAFVHEGNKKKKKKAPILRARFLCDRACAPVSVTMVSAVCKKPREQHGGFLPRAGHCMLVLRWRAISTANFESAQMVVARFDSAPLFAPRPDDAFCIIGRFFATLAPDCGLEILTSRIPERTANRGAGISRVERRQWLLRPRSRGAGNANGGSRLSFHFIHHVGTDASAGRGAVAVGGRRRSWRSSEVPLAALSTWR